MLTTKKMITTYEDVQIENGYYRSGTQFHRVTDTRVTSIMNLETTGYCRTCSEKPESFNVPAEFEPCTEAEFETAYQIFIASLN